MRLKYINILSLINLFLWFAFVWVDRIWGDVLFDAVSRKQGTLGEIYGPISFFRPVILYSALALTIILSFSLFIMRDKFKK